MAAGDNSGPSLMVILEVGVVSTSDDVDLFGGGVVGLASGCEVVELGLRPLA